MNPSTLTHIHIYKYRRVCVCKDRKRESVCMRVFVRIQEKKNIYKSSL